MNRSILWAQIGETGLEHLHISQQKGEIIADGLVIDYPGIWRRV